MPAQIIDGNAPEPKPSATIQQQVQSSRTEQGLRAWPGRDSCRQRPASEVYVAHKRKD